MVIKEILELTTVVQFNYLYFVCTKILKEITNANEFTKIKLTIFVLISKNLLTNKYGFEGRNAYA